jgi:ribosomal protein S27AE
MDTTKKIVCPKCGHENMDGHGANLGGRIMTYQKKCPECGLILLIVPMKEEFEYSVSARTTEEIKERLKKENRLRELEKETDELRTNLRRY